MCFCEGLDRQQHSNESAEVFTNTSKGRCTVWEMGTLHANGEIPFFFEELIQILLRSVQRAVVLSMWI